MEHVLTFDGTGLGFLSLMFECYAQKLNPVSIYNKNSCQDQLFADVVHIETSNTKAERVWKGIQRRLGFKGNRLSAHPMSTDAERLYTMLNKMIRLDILFENDTDSKYYMLLHEIVRMVFDRTDNFMTDWAGIEVNALRKVDREITQEALRMLQFVRFEKTKDDIYFSPIEPRFNVLPLILKHFKDRFADQVWLIYDLKRDYGAYYDKTTIHEITIDHKEFDRFKGQLYTNAVDEEEVQYQRAWQSYCKNISIQERCNKTLQRQHMPARYWKFLHEKR